MFDLPDEDYGVRDVHFNSDFDKVVGVAESSTGTQSFFTVDLSTLDFKKVSLANPDPTLAPLMLVDDSASSVIWLN